MPDRKLCVFLCHASQDKPVVRELYQRLIAEGWIDPWLDEEKLLPGQDWDMEIEKAVEAADAVIVCLSGTAVKKEGYIQKEIRKVLDVSNKKPENTIFIIPLRLDECQLPHRFKTWQYEDFFPIGRRNKAIERILISLDARAKEKYGLLEQQLVDKGNPKILATLSDNKDTQENLRATEDLQISLFGPIASGKTSYLVSLYIAATKRDSNWVIGIDDGDLHKRYYLLGQADEFVHGNWPSATFPVETPDSFRLRFYPDKSQRGLAFSNVSEAGINIKVFDPAGQSFFEEPLDGPFWKILSASFGIVCLIDLDNVETLSMLLNNFITHLSLRTIREHPEELIAKRFLPHHVSVCFAKMDKPHMRPFFDSPRKALDNLNKQIGIDVEKHLKTYFLPENVTFHCISSAGFDYDAGLDRNLKQLEPVNVFSPIEDFLSQLGNFPLKRFG